MQQTLSIYSAIMLSHNAHSLICRYVSTDICRSIRKIVNILLDYVGHNRLYVKGRSMPTLVCFL